jgi:internalin A
VKSDREEKIIYIRVSGNPPTRRNLLAVARSQFDHIHRTIPRIEAEEKVGYEGILLDYQDLLELERAGEETWYVPKLKKKVNVKEVLNGFEPERDRAIRERNMNPEEKTDGQFNDDSSPNSELKDFPTKKQKPSESSSPRVKSSWANGLFYVFIFVVVIISLTWAAGQVSFLVLGLIIIGGLLFIPLIGAMQFRQDNRLSQKSFLELMAMVLKQLPLIQGLLPSQSQREKKNG